MSEGETNEGVTEAAAEEKAGSWKDAIRGNVLAMGLVSLFTDFSSEMIYPLLPMFFTGLVPLGVAALYVGLMEGVAESTASLLKIFSGRISDRLGKRKALVLGGYGLSTIARPAMALAFAAWNVVGLRFLDRVGKGVRTSPRDALIGDSVPAKHRGLAFSFHRMMDHTGAVLGPVVAVLVLMGMLGYTVWRGGEMEDRGATEAEMHALRWLFGIALIPGLLAVAAIVLKVKEVSPKASAKAGAAKKGTWRDLPGKFYFFVAVVTLFALGNSSDLFLLLYGQTKFGFGMGGVLVLWVGLHVSKIVFSIPGGILSDKLGRRGVIIAGWIVYALVYLGMAEVNTAWQFCALFVAYGFFYGMTEGSEKALVADFAPSEYRGTAYGIYHGAVGMAALPASVLFGVVWMAVDSAYPGWGPRVAFGTGAALAGLAAVLLVILVSTKGKQTQAVAA